MMRSLVAWPAIAALALTACNHTAAKKDIWVGRANPQRTGVFESPALRRVTTSLWKAKATVASSLSIADRQLFYLDGRSTVHSLDIDTGQEKWTAATAVDRELQEVLSKDNPGKLQMMLSAWIVPLVMDGTVYAPSGDGVWAIATAEERKGSNGLAIVNWFRQSPAGKAAEQSRIRWRLSGAQRAMGQAPLIRGDTLFFGDIALHAVTMSTQIERWTTQVSRDDKDNPLVPALLSDTLYVVSRVSVRALDVETGQNRWSFSREAGTAVPSEATIAVSGGQVFVADWSGQLSALDISTGRPQWTATGLGEGLVAPVVADDTVYVADMKGQVSAITRVHRGWMDPATGASRWRRDLGTHISLDGLSMADGVLYVGTERGIFALDAKSGNQLWKYDLPGTEMTVAGPVMKDGTMYFATQTSIYALR
jgi:outer membrane protein assembly factor BamB